MNMNPDSSGSVCGLPLVVRELLLQQEHLGLELVPLVEDVPQLLQGEARPVGVLLVQARRLLLPLSLLQGHRTTCQGGKEGSRGGKDGWVRARRDRKGREQGRKEGRKDGFMGQGRKDGWMDGWMEGGIERTR